MSEQLHPGIHPDPDSLNAFLEGVLPEHERIQCLAHLAECPRCREVVFLAQETSPAAAAPVPVSARRWFTPAPVLALAAALCIVVAAVWLYSRHTAGAPNRDLVAHMSKTPPPQAPPSASDTTPEAHAPEQARPRTEQEKALLAHAPRTMPPPVAAAAPPILPAPPSIAIPASPIQNAQGPTIPDLLPVIPAPPKPPGAEIKEERAAATGLSGISGTVIDPSGAVISGATIHVRQLDGTFTADARTDITGQFKVEGLAAGRYELRIGAPGFRDLSRQVDLQRREVAAIKSQLDVGSVAETVEVTAAASTLQTSMSRVNPSRKKAGGPRALPSKLTAGTTVTSGNIMLAVDSAGTVFVSRNLGRSWKKVKPVWPGEIGMVALADPSQTPTAAFQLTTDSGAVWLSRDGAHWYPSAPQH